MTGAPDWTQYRPVVTVVDVLDTGACLDGVKSWVSAHRGTIAGPADKYAQEHIRKATQSDGDGDGDGYGYGYGYGYGDGYGQSGPHED